MKIVLIVFMLMFNLIARAQNETEKYGLTKAGLIAELVRLKETSELFLGQILDSEKDSVISKRGQTCIAKYSYLRMLSDQFIVQLITDLTASNKPKIFKKLNTFFKTHSIFDLESVDASKEDAAIQEYVEQYKIVFNASRQFYSCTKSTQALTLPDPIDFISTIQGVIKDINEARASKVEKLAKILDSLRLSAAQDLKKPKKNEEEKP